MKTLKNRLVPIVLLALAAPALASAQSDPLAASFLPAIDTNAAHYPANIWVTDTMQKVRQNTGAPGATHWGTFYGTQNEFVDFQVHVQAPAAGYSALTITAGNFVQTSPSSFTISAASRNIVVYREAYMNVSIRTSTAPAYYNATGFYPDILIPTVDPYSSQTTNAFPVAVAGNQNQSAWIDVLIPPTAPSGYYLGSVTVKNGATTLATLPIIIAVWQWPTGQGGSMPSTATLIWGAGVGFDTLCRQQGGSCSSTYPGAAQGEAVDLGAMMLDNRISNSGSNQNFPDTGSFSSFDTQMGPLLSGTTPGWHYNTILSGAKQTQQALQCGGNCFPNSNAAAIWSNWVSHFSSKGWLSDLVYGIADEPSGGAWASFITNANASRSFSTPMVPLQVTTSLQFATANNALNAIDQLVVNVVCMEPLSAPWNSCGTTTAGSQRAAYNSWLSGKCCSGAGPTRTLQAYISCSSAGTCGNGTVGSGLNYPNYSVDAFPATSRVMEWLTFRNNESGELYYALDYCFWNTCGQSGTTDPWTSVYAFGGQGDGTLVYPGTTAHLGSGVTTPIWLPSFRLKMIRDGMQDYEYLNVLTKVGQGSFASTQLQSWITNSYTYDFSGAGLQTARQALGTKLHQITFGTIVLPPTKLGGTLQ
jgi:hypothetical protein